MRVSLVRDTRRRQQYAPFGCAQDNICAYKDHVPQTNSYPFAPFFCLSNTFAITPKKQRRGAVIPLSAIIQLLSYAFKIFDFKKQEGASSMLLKSSIWLLLKIEDFKSILLAPSSGKLGFTSSNLESAFFVSRKE